MPLKLLPLLENGLQGFATEIYIGKSRRILWSQDLNSDITEVVIDSQQRVVLHPNTDFVVLALWKTPF
jgi:hypothetical protein